MLSMVGLVESHDEIAMKNQAMSEQERRAQVRPYLLRRFGHAAVWARGGCGRWRVCDARKRCLSPGEGCELGPSRPAGNGGAHRLCDAL